MLTLLFTMFSNYCSQGAREPQRGDTREEAPKPPVRPTVLSLVINKSTTRFYPDEESGQIRPELLQVRLDYRKSARGDCWSRSPSRPIWSTYVGRCTSDSKHCTHLQGRGNLPLGFLATLPRALWASSNQIFQLS